MDAAYKSKHLVKKPVAPRRAAPRRKRDDRRSLVQLLVSLGLFLLVFLGRGAFPAQIEAWSEIIETDVNFSAVFQKFGHALAEKEGAVQALKVLGLSLLGGQPEEPPVSSQPPREQAAPVPLGQTGRLGLEAAEEYGIVIRPERKPQESKPPKEVEGTPEPTPEIVTAMAQAYASDGTKLPSNVSFQFYELGLAKTVVPVRGEVTSGFGYRISPVNGKREFHLALDIAAAEGTKVGAFADGTVQYIGESDEFGLYLKIRHANGVSTFYAHCSKLLVRKGDKVTCGQTIALVGSTGNVTGAHLHLTIEKDNVRLDPAHYVDL